MIGQKNKEKNGNCIVCGNPSKSSEPSSPKPPLFPNFIHELELINFVYCIALKQSEDEKIKSIFSEFDNDRR
jgi:hypothetical protein